MSFECNINIEAYSADLESTCVVEGGQLVEKDLVVTCSGEVQNFTIPDGFTVNVFKAPLFTLRWCQLPSRRSPL
jgi:hypothetical protein